MILKLKKAGSTLHFYSWIYKWLKYFPVRATSTIFFNFYSMNAWIVQLVKQFDNEVGLKYLCGMHLNDSKAARNSKKDRHENIGL